MWSGVGSQKSEVRSQKSEVRMVALGLRDGKEASDRRQCSAAKNNAAPPAFTLSTPHFLFF
jgi:hypothetical protein